MRITVVHSHAPRQLWLRELDLDSGATVREALAASGLLDAFPTLDLGACTVAVWGQRAQPTERLREGDRVEVCRPLKVDPKVARRERFRAQGMRTAGLFAQAKAPKKN
ncbi:RnfH family protein [Tibeticola sp.]|uniref:RnfH family protein n=1 Tax=Tibeticola sp. TaxID=2005368 RepID=UPI00258B471C|nr:RnfH family protein [Tibeticola sp.]MCI4440710.1 RnfH family protein [Tibeticola sp.]